MPKPSTVLALVVSVLAFLYSLAGVAMAYWLSAVPGNRRSGSA